MSIEFTLYPLNFAHSLPMILYYELAHGQFSELRRCAATEDKVIIFSSASHGHSHIQSGMLCFHLISLIHFSFLTKNHSSWQLPRWPHRVSAS